MKINLPQLYFSKLMRAIVEFEMIENGDHILLGISGGKDSIFLAYAMAILRERLKKDFCLSALNINPMFQPEFNVAPVAEFCASLGIPFATREVDIAGAIQGQAGKKACFTCSYFRRGAINRYAKEHGMNKIAYAHHHDDAVETFFMSLLYSGQLTTFSPVTYLDRTDLTVIRPLIYFREDELREAGKYHGCTPIPSPCPLDGKTMRQKTKELIAELGRDNPLVYDHLASAMRKGSLGELWPAAKTRDEMKETYYRYMNPFCHPKEGKSQERTNVI
ncbi:MAG: tRNA 2-thiocytidine biosynthesis protein TtcA [Selenomonadaceae bacterium]|nr:tRNA 2-thiocytidine biosynthesis protein TtcA [Selenomonadaceae bacterium]